MQDLPARSQRKREAESQRVTDLMAALKSSVAREQLGRVLAEPRTRTTASGIPARSVERRPGTRKVSLSMPPELVEQAEKAIARGEAESMSGWFAEAATQKLETELLRSFLTELDDQFGPVEADRLEAAREDWARLLSS